jgi:hypothetical protein
MVRLRTILLSLFYERFISKECTNFTTLHTIYRHLVLYRNNLGLLLAISVKQSFSSEGSLQLLQDLH